MATVVASAARTATGNSGALVLPVIQESGANALARCVALLVRTTAVSGTSPTMTVSVEWSVDGTNFMRGDPADAFTAITTTANGVLAKKFEIKAPIYRIVWTIGGTTPSFTFQIDDHATI